MGKANDDVEQARLVLEKATEKLQAVRANRKILCACGEKHRIKDLALECTQYYHEPHGCTEGDYYTESEWQFVCPTTEIRNRLLYSNDYKIPWEDRHGMLNAELAFKAMYRRLFKSTKDVYDRALTNNGYNNYYVDNNRAKFELPPVYKKDACPTR